MDLTITKKYFIIPEAGNGGGGTGDSDINQNAVDFLKELVEADILPKDMLKILEGAEGEVQAFGEESNEGQGEAQGESGRGDTQAPEETIWDKVRSIAGLRDRARKNRW